MINFLAQYLKIVRSLSGGHWEQWYLKPYRYPVWIKVDFCHFEREDTYANRPSPLAIGEPECEDYVVVHGTVKV